MPKYIKCNEMVLVNAITEQAAKDYEKAIKTIKKMSKKIAELEKVRDKLLKQIAKQKRKKEDVNYKEYQATAHKIANAKAKLSKAEWEKAGIERFFTDEKRLFAQAYDIDGKRFLKQLKEKIKGKEH